MDGHIQEGCFEIMSNEEVNISEKKTLSILDLNIKVKLENFGLWMNAEQKIWRQQRKGSKLTSENHKDALCGMRFVIILDLQENNVDNRSNQCAKTRGICERTLCVNMHGN